MSVKMGVCKLTLNPFIPNGKCEPGEAKKYLDVKFQDVVSGTEFYGRITEYEFDNAYIRYINFPKTIIGGNIGSKNHQQPKLGHVYTVRNQMSNKAFPGKKYYFVVLKRRSTSANDAYLLFTARQISRIYRRGKNQNSEIQKTSILRDLFD